MNDDIDRRTVISWTGAAAGTVALAGCLGNGDDGENGTSDENGNGDEDETDDELEVVFPEIGDPPNAVYRPTHREPMVMVDPVEAGDYRLAPMLSYPHPFWIIAGSGDGAVNREEPDQPGVHMMFTLWDAETGTVLPVDDGIQVDLFFEGERIESQSTWSMLSQQMGFHFGDNVPLEEEGTYTVEVDLPPLAVRTSGALEGRFTDAETAVFEFEYNQEFQAAVTDVDYFDEERWGERGALGPMGHSDDGHDDHGNGHGDHDDHDDHGHVPYSQVPEVDAFPGTLLVDPDGGRPEETADLPRSGDAAFLVTLLESDHRLADGEQSLLVSPRTPYNRVPLPAMSLHATADRDDEPVELEQTIDSEYGFHYGASLGDVEPGDAVTFTVDAPPQITRHQGYETAFLEMPPIELEVPEDS